MVCNANGHTYYSSFMHLVSNFSVLERELESFGAYLLCLRDNNTQPSTYKTDTLLKLQKIIIRQKIWCSRYQTGIPSHLEECREWNVFPDSFWDEVGTQQNLPDSCHSFSSGNHFSSALHSILQNLELMSEATDKCLTNYQYSGYIDHQPVAIDLLDYLIDIYGQLQDTIKQVQMIVRKDFSTK